MPSGFFSSSLFRRVHRGLAAEPGEALREREELLLRDAAFERDALDLVVLQLPNQLRHRRAELVHRRVGDDQVAADDAHRDGGLLLVQRGEHGDKARHVPRDQRMIGRVELRVADARGDPPQQIFVQRDS